MTLFAIALPFMGGVGVPELLIILFIILLLFGPKRLPQLGKMFGKTMKNIKDGVEGKLEEGDEEEEPVATKAKADEEKSAKSEDS